jgi:Uma2 family endonuclease
MTRDPLLAQIPYKLELNERGSMEVSPATTRHASLQALLASELKRLKPGGITLTQCAVETELGVRVPDVAWASPDFVLANGLDTPLPNAPDLCIEMLSRLNPRAQMLDKVTAYLAAGAREVWLVSEDGSLEILSARGVQTRSCFDVDIKLPMRRP